MQQERGAARQFVGVSRQLCFENAEAGLQRLAEALFLAGEHVDDEVAVAGDLWIGATHHIDSRLDQRWHDELLGAE